MSTVTITTNANGTLDAAEIYSSFMSQVEPDLMLSNVDSLEEKYADETPEEKDARGARYKAAFAKYKDFFESFVGVLKEGVSQANKQDMASKEAADKQAEVAQLKHLEDLLG